MRVFCLRIFVVTLAAVLGVAQPVFVSATTTNDRFADELWYLDQVRAPAAWEMTTGNSDVIVAVLDAGFDLDHEDLVDVFWRNEREIPGDGLDNDGNGFEDDVQGWDFVDGDGEPWPNTDNVLSDSVISHGTVISGLIGAEANNGLGIAGLAHGVQIMPLRILDENGAGTTTNVRRAVVYAVENGADVINLSFVSSAPDERLHETLEWAHDQGVVVVAAVGNGNVDTDVQPMYPACADTLIGRNVVIGVAASTREDQKADFSNYGTSCVDITAPGTNVFGAVYHESDNFFFSTSYGSPWEGSSMAAPMVSAGAALLRSAFPSLTPDQIRNALKLSVDPVAEGSLEARKRLGAGRLNVSRALEMATVFAGVGSGGNFDRQVNPSGSLVVAQGAGSGSMVHRFDDHGTFLDGFSAYPEGFLGGVSLAMGDVTGDGAEEIVTGAGPSGGPQVRIFDLNGHVVGQFFAFDEGDRGGIRVATGDVNGDGVEEILVTPIRSATGQVRIFNRHGHLKGSFFPFDRTEQPLFISAGDVDDDDDDEIVVTKLSGGEGQARVFDGSGRYVRSIQVDSGVVSGLTSTVVDVNGDGMNDVVLASTDHDPVVWAYSQTGQELLEFFAYPLHYQGGIHISGADVDGDGSVELFVTPLSGGPQVRVFNGRGELIGQFFAVDGVNRYGAVVSIWGS